MKRKLPTYFYNWTTFLGVGVAALGVVVLFLVVLLDVFVKPASLYVGMFTYIILPLIVFVGLGLIGAGAWRERRRLQQGLAPSFDPVIVWDFRNPHHRHLLWIGVLSVSAFLLASTLGTYKAYHVTESTEFCGLVCHTVMKPEYTAYQGSPHARVPCVACHIGSGADWYVKSKLTGLRQLYRTVLHSYHRPIETPIRNLRPARDTCEKCHWPEKFFGDRLLSIPHYLADEKNTAVPVSLLLKTGGGHNAHGPGKGIHWHMALANKVEYIARDRKRQDIAWVRFTRAGGETVEYNNSDNPLSDAEKAQSEIRVMDCMDCHNRPSHQFRSPVKEVDAALASGALSGSLPFIKREAVKVLDADYPNTATALQTIGDGLKAFYQMSFPEVSRERSSDIQTAIATVQEIYSKNFFPEMKVTWREYPENVGHMISAGCFRCHGDNMKTAEGVSITKDCSSCHEFMPSQKSRTALMGPSEFQHPVDIGGMEKEGTCASCHQGGAELY